MDLYDYKPQMDDWYDKDLPESIRMGQRLTTMTCGQTRFPIAPSKYKFAQHGQCGMWVTELLPYTSKMVDEMCFIRSMHTEAINHEPAITYMQTGNQITGRPCLGSWVSYGLGSLNDNLPTFVVLVARPSNNEQIQAISARLWSSGYLSGEHAGVSFRSGGDPILFINNPPGVPSEVRRATLDGLRALNEQNYQIVGDPETRTRIEQYEMAFRMQSSVPELTDLASEPDSTYELYGEDAKKPGSFANTALLARRMVERGVRFVQIYHNNWDHHANVAGRMPDQCRDVDQPTWGLVQDLKSRGLLDDTLIIWGGEFGRTIYSQGGVSHENYGRDHHPRCFTMWMAGGGSRPAPSTAKPTTSPTTSSRIPSTSATSTPPCSSSWASTTSASPTATRASTRSSPASSPPASSPNSWPDFDKTNCRIAKASTQVPIHQWLASKYNPVLSI